MHTPVRRPVAALALLLFACGKDPVVNSDSDAVEEPGSASAAGAEEGGRVIPRAPVPTPPETTTVPPPEVVDCPRGDDVDGDGFTREAGDCNDCDKVINPGAYDFPGNMFDEDCVDGPAQAESSVCDQGLEMASTQAQDAARAIGLCKFTSRDRRDWGVIEARFTTATGGGSLDSPLQVGLLPRFGAAEPRAGQSLLALSSGVARAPDQPAYTRTYNDTFNGTFNEPPMGFPKPSSACPQPFLFQGTSRLIYNEAALELTIRVPTNARSLSFDSIFYSYEYPDYICQPFNDFFVTLLEPFSEGDGNIVFDGNNDPIGVNTGLLAVCDPALQPSHAAKQFSCDQGTALLRGTGFGAGEYSEPSLLGEVDGRGGGSTGWLTTSVPSAPGTIIKLRFAIWDTGDLKVDSTALIDRFTWSVEQPSTPSTKPTPVLL